GCELRRKHGFHVLSERSHDAELQFAKRAFAKPIGDFNRAQRAERADAGMAAMRKWQDQHFEIKACAIDGVAGYPGNGTCRITRHRSEQVDDLSAACLTPQAGKRLTFELAAEQRTDARAGEPKPMLVHEIGREHERVAQYLPDRDRI